MCVCFEGLQKRWKPDSTGSGPCSPGPQEEVTDGQVRAVWEELGVGAGGSLSRQELSLVCEHIGLKNLQSEVSRTARHTHTLVIIS